MAAVQKPFLKGRKHGGVTAVAATEKEDSDGDDEVDMAGWGGLYPNGGSDFSRGIGDFKQRPGEHHGSSLGHTEIGAEY